MISNILLTVMSRLCVFLLVSVQMLCCVVSVGVGVGVVPDVVRLCWLHCGVFLLWRYEFEM